MKRKVLPILLLTICINIYGQEQKTERKAHWIENAGFYIDNDEDDIIIDGILNGDDDLANAKGKYTDVSLIFVSHVHVDHFDAQGVLKHLKLNRKAHLICTPETFESIKSLGLDISIKSRIHVSFPNIDTSERLTIDKYRIDILQFEHSGVQNIGFALKGNNLSIVYINGSILNQKILSNLSKEYNLPDILIANKWLLTKTKYISSLKEAFNPRLIFMAHHNGRNDEIVSNNGGLEQIQEKMTIGTMEGIIFEHKMQFINF